MLKKVKKDKNLRSKFLLIELQNNILKSLTKNTNFSKLVAWNSGFKVMNTISKFNKTKLVNRCIYSGRYNKTHYYYRFSRLSFLQFARNSMIPGVFKSPW